MSTGAVLVSGGAGFIGSYVAEQLLHQGYVVRVYDSLIPQVHQGAGPQYVPASAEFIAGDVRDRDGLARALHGVDQVVHLAAEVGVGQSMYEVSRYVNTNIGGTGVLLDIIANDNPSVPRIVVASSMSIYGEGSYQCPQHGLTTPGPRSKAQRTARRWDPQCLVCGETLSPVPTAEDARLLPTSVYAISKMDQELLCLSVRAAHGIGVVALRYFNAYGPRQALSNPYTGVAASFSGRLLNRRPPLAFEDGRQLRDLVHVRDVARATVLALERDKATGQAVNVGVGAPLTIAQVAQLLAKQLGVDVEPEITGKSRAGDIRHCYADTTRAEQLLGFKAEIPLEAGMAELTEWVATQAVDDQIGQAYAELGRRGLVI